MHDFEKPSAALISVARPCATTENHYPPALDIRRNECPLAPSRQMHQAREVALAARPLGEILQLSGSEIRRAIGTLVDRLDQLDGDPDLEADEDRCTAEDDHFEPMAQPRNGIGDAEDAEDSNDAEKDDDYEA